MEINESLYPKQIRIYFVEINKQFSTTSSKTWWTK